MSDTTTPTSPPSQTSDSDYEAVYGERSLEGMAWKVAHRLTELEGKDLDREVAKDTALGQVGVLAEDVRVEEGYSCLFEQFYLLPPTRDRFWWTVSTEIPAPSSPTASSAACPLADDPVTYTEEELEVTAGLVADDINRMYEVSDKARWSFRRGLAFALQANYVAPSDCTWHKGETSDDSYAVLFDRWGIYLDPRDVYLVSKDYTPPADPQPHSETPPEPTKTTTQPALSSDAALLSALARPFPATAIKRGKDSEGKAFDYIAWQSYLLRLTSVAGFSWSKTLHDLQVEQADGGMWHASLLCRLELTVPSGSTCVREGAGVGYENTGSHAATKAEQKAFANACQALFGAGLQLTIGDDYATAVNLYARQG